MAITAEHLVYQLTAKVSGFEDEMTVAASVFNKATEKIEAGFGRMDRRIEESARANRINIKSLTATATGVLGAREVIQYADAWAKAKNALTAAKVPAEQQAAVLDRLYGQAQRYSTELNAQVALFGNVSRAASGLTNDQEDLFKFTEAVAASLKADGRSAAEASGALLQLGQALRGPIIQAEEFNSLIDGAPALLEAAANGIDKYNGDVSKLIRAAKDGELATRDFFEGVLKGSDELKARVGQSADTFEGAFQKIENALTRYIGQTDEGLGASQRLIAGLNAFADDFDDIADTVLKLAAVISGALVGRAIGGVLIMIPPVILALKLLSIAATAGATSASFLAARFGAATASIVTATAATRAFRLAAASMLVGPIGLIIGGVATAMFAFGQNTEDAGEYTEAAAAKAERYAAALRRVKGEADAAGVASKASGRQFLATEINRTNQQLKGDVAEAARLEAEYRRVLDRLIDGFKFRGGEGKPLVLALEAIRDALGENVDGAVDAQEALNSLANENPNFQPLADELNPLLDRLIGVREEIEGLSADMTDLARKSLADLKLFRDADRASMVNLRDSERRGQAVLDERTRRANLDPTEREIEDRMKQISEEIAKAGKSAADAIEGAGAIMSEAAIRAQAEQELRAERRDALIGENSSAALDRYVSRVIGAESGGDRFAKNPLSTATGLGQFIESTWIDLFKRHFPDRAQGLTDSAILAFRTSADDNHRLIRAYAEENAAVLQRAGLAVTETALHLSHFLGAGDAVKVLSAAPGTPLRGLISSAAIESNESILGGGRTVDDAIRYGEKRAGTARVAAGDLTPSEEAVQKQIDKRKELKATIDVLLGSVDEETKQILLETTLMNESTSERERLITVARLENDLKRAGITLDKEGNGVNAEGVVVHRNLRAAIEELAAARGVEAAANEMAIESLRSLKDAEQFAIDQMDAFRDSARDVLGGFISDLRSGKSAAEALGNALEKIADKLINSGIDQFISSLFGAQGTAGGGIFGSLFGGLFGGGRNSFPAAPIGLYAKGGVTRRPAIFGEAGPEAAVPLPDGRRIPVDLRMPKINRQLQQSSGMITIHVAAEEGEMFRPTIRAESQGVAVKVVQQNDKARRNYYQSGGNPR